MEAGKSQGKYTVEQMQQMGTVAQTADGLEISGNNFKVNALCGCPDMVLFACERIKDLEALLFKASQQIYDQPELEQEIQDSLD